MHTMSPYSRATRINVASGSRNTCNASPSSGVPLGPGGSLGSFADEAALDAAVTVIFSRALGGRKNRLHSLHSLLRSSAPIHCIKCGSSYLLTMPIKDAARGLAVFSRIG